MHILHHFPFHVEHVRNPRHWAVLDAAKLFQKLKVQARLGIGKNALAGNRTQVNCLEGSYAYHYTTNATIVINYLEILETKLKYRWNCSNFSFSPISSLKTKGDSRVTNQDRVVPWCNG